MNKSLLKWVMCLSLIWMFMGCNKSQCFEKERCLESAEILSDTTFACFLSECGCLFYDHYPRVETDATNGQLASLSSTLTIYSGLNALLNATRNPKYAELIEIELMSVLEHYQNSISGMYQSTPNDDGTGECDYAENAQLGAHLVNSFALTENYRYLILASNIWKKLFGLGVDLKVENAKLISIASVFALKLYEQTSDRELLETLEIWMEWLRENKQLMSGDGMYHGLLMEAFSIFAELTDQKDYLYDSEAIVKEYVDTNAWENVSQAIYLWRGMYRLYLYSGNPEYVDKFAQSFYSLYMDRNPLSVLIYEQKGTREQAFLHHQGIAIEVLSTISQ